MKSYKEWATAGIGFSIVCILVGCGTTHGSTDAPITNAVRNTPVAMNTTHSTNAATSSASTASNVGQMPIAPSADNFVVTNIQAPKTVFISGNAYTPPKLVHGALEPIVMTIHFSKIQTPIDLELQNLGLNNPSSNVGGGIDYFQYQGEIYKLRKQQRGAFPVKNKIVLSGDSTITFVSSVGTPTPPGVKLQFRYGNMNIGSYPVTNTASFELH